MNYFCEHLKVCQHLFIILVLKFFVSFINFTHCSVVVCLAETLIHPNFLSLFFFILFFPTHRTNTNLPIFANATTFVGELIELNFKTWHMKIEQNWPFWKFRFYCYDCFSSKFLCVLKLFFSHCFCKEISVTWEVDQQNGRSQSVKRNRSIGKHFWSDWNQPRAMITPIVF